MIPRWTIVVLLLLLAPWAAASPRGPGDPRLLPWLEAVTAWGHGPGGEAVFHALAAHAGTLPAEPLRRALAGPAPRGMDPLAAAARDQLAAALDREAGELAAARRRVARQGFLLSWRVLLPERLAGTPIEGDPGSGWVSPGDHARFSGVEPVLLEATLPAAGTGGLLLLVGGDGVAGLQAGDAEGRFPLREGSLLDQAALCAGPSAGSRTVRLELHPDRAGRSFSVRLAEPDGTPVPAGRGVANGGSGTCRVGVLERWEQALAGPRLPPASIAGLWLLSRAGLPSPDDTLLSRLQPRSWIELGLLSEILAERRQAWEALCLRTPGCPGAWQAELLAAEVELRRGQAFLALRRILRSSPPEGGDADTGLREARRRLLADLLQGLGLVSAALRELGPRTPAWAPDHLDAWTSSALAAGAREEALAALLEEHGRRPGSREIGTLVASLLSDEGRVEEAEAIWARLESLYPGDPDLPLERAELLARLGRGEEALGHLDALVARFPCNARVRDRQGIILARLGRVEEAAAAWRAGHSLEPQNPELQARLQRMEPGGRHWRALRRDLSWALAAAAEAPGEQPLEGLADVRLVTIHPDGLLSIHRQQILRVNRPGADAELTLGEVYDPHSEDLTTLLAVVLRGTGEVSLALEGDDVSLSQEEFNLYYDMRQRLRTFPRIEPGDVVLWETRMDQFRGARGGVSLVRPLQEGFPKRRVDVSLLSPPGLDLHAAMLLHTGEPAPEPPPLPTPEGTLVTWRLEDLEGMPARPLPPPLTERSAHLAVSSMTGWRQVAEWYQALLDQQAADAPALRVLADGLSRAASPLEATARFVADDVRYVGLEFGVNAYVPYPSARVLERRYGDCKDKSLLMVTLLRRLGLEAHVALVRTYPFGALRDPPPSISLFDHAIVRIPGPDVWFDPTARYLGTRSLPWQNQGAQVLVLDDDPVLELLPVAPAEENRAALRLLIHGHGGRHQVSATGEFLGAQARANYEVVQDPARWDAEVERFIGGLVPGFRLQEAPWEVREGGVPAFSLEVEGFLEPGGPGELTLFGGQRYLPRLAGLTSRTEDLVLRFPFQEATILEIDALGVRLAGPSMDTGEAPGCRWEVSTAPGRLEVMVELPARRVAAQDYGAFRACLGALDTALARVRLQVPGETP